MRGYCTVAGCSGPPEAAKKRDTRVRSVPAWGPDTHPCTRSTNDLRASSGSGPGKVADERRPRRAEPSCDTPDPNFHSCQGRADAKALGSQGADERGGQAGLGRPTTRRRESSRGPGMELGPGRTRRRRPARGARGTRWTAAARACRSRMWSAASAWAVTGCTAISSGSAAFHSRACPGGLTFWSSPGCANQDGFSCHTARRGWS
jgi:hypothetical protein